jgi:hypothetical protein
MGKCLRKRGLGTIDDISSINDISYIVQEYVGGINVGAKFRADK